VAQAETYELALGLVYVTQDGREKPLCEIAAANVGYGNAEEFKSGEVLLVTRLYNRCIPLIPLSRLLTYLFVYKSLAILPPYDWLEFVEQITRVQAVAAKGSFPLGMPIDVDANIKHRKRKGKFLIYITWNVWSKLQSVYLSLQLPLVVQDSVAVSQTIRPVRLLLPGNVFWASFGQSSILQILKSGSIRS